MEYDWKGSRPIFEKAIRLNPNYPLAHLFYANMFFYPGDKERGMSELRKALDLDPLSTTLNYVLGRRYYELRDYDQAIVQLQKTLKLTPNYPAANLYLGLCNMQMKDYQPAIDVFKRLPPDQWTRAIMLSYAYSMAGDKSRAKALLEKALKEERITSPYLLSLAYIGLGDTNKALTQLERAYETRDIFIITLKIDPELDPLRNEPRFKALQKKTNLE
jgi:Tfp pilus assembly protein PilF